MDAILPGGIYLNVTQAERDVIERTALSRGTLTPVQTRNGTHIITEYVGDVGAF